MGEEVAGSSPAAVPNFSPQRPALILQAGFRFFLTLPPPRRGAPHRSAWTHQAERPHQRNKAGRAVFRLPPGGDEGRAGGRSGPPRTLSLQPPSPIFGAQPPHSPRLWGTLGPLSYLSFPPGAGGRTEQQRPPGRAAGAWCRPAQVRRPSSRSRRPRLRVPSDTKPPPPSWPSPPKHAARAGALVPRSAAITPARAAPWLRVQGHPEPPRAGGPRKQDPSHRRGNRLNPRAS